MAVKTFVADKVTVRAKHSTESTPRDGGGDQHLLMRIADGFTYWSYLHFVLNWDGVLKITKAELVLTVKDRTSHVGTPSKTNRIKATRLAAAFTDPNNAAAEGVFATGSYPSSAVDGSRVASGYIGHLNESVHRLDVTRFMEAEAPKSVKRRDGGPGLALTHHGLILQNAQNASFPETRAIAASDKHADAAARPYIELTYEAVPDEGTVLQDGPPTSIVDITDQSFEGTYTPGRAGDTISWVELELYLEGGATPVWSYADDASASDKETNTFTVPMTKVATTGSRLTMLSSTGYEWRVRVRNQRGEQTVWTSRLNVTLTTDAPVLSALSPATGKTFSTLNAVLFGASYSDANGNPLLHYQMQARTVTLPTDPDWDDDLLWDSTEVTPTATEKSTRVIRRPYGGTGLAAGTYSWRVRATDIRGGVSAWLYGDFILTKGWEPDPGDIDFLTGYGRRQTRARILIKAMNHRVQRLTMVGATSGTWKLSFDGEETASTINFDTTAAGLTTRLEELPNIAPGDVSVAKSGDTWEVTFAGAWAGRNVPLIEWVNTELLLPATARVQIESNREPGLPVAIIEDAANMGASEMYNDGGEFFFNLPATHPQVAVIEPYQVHYALEHYQGEGWKEKAAGLIIDFDGTDDDVIFYGIDYLAVLARMVDERFNATTSPDAAAVLYPATGGGSKYVNQTIKAIVTDQLQRAINGPNSPLRFFTLGTIDDMDETVTIFSTFKQRGPFIAGLLESHKAGTGLRTRLRVRKSVTGVYSFIVEDTPGKDRDNFRLEYGGLIQGFRVLPFGNFATRVHGIGRAFNQLKVEHYIADAPVPTGEETDFLESRYGRWPVANIWQDITDLNDLKRRARQLSRSVGKVGKSVALGLRVHALGVKDGWDICDSVVVDIDRGVVDTMAMGSGYYTIWGWTWVYKPDGEEQLTLSLLPREDTEAADLDLITSDPINSTRQQWQIEDRDPDSALDVDVQTHVNSVTGHIFQRDSTTGDFVDQTVALTGTPLMAGDGLIDTPQLAAGAVTETKLADGALAIEKFAAGVRPVPIVAALPALPDAVYPEGQTVVLTTDGKLYRNVADAWVKSVDGGDITALSIVAASIAAGAIGATKIAAGAVTADKIAVGDVRAYHLGNDPKNLLPYPGAEYYVPASDSTLYALPGWTLNSQSSIRRTNNFHRSGACAFQFVTSTVADVTAFETLVTGIEGNRRYRVRAWLSGFSGNVATFPVVQVIIQWRDISGALIAQNSLGGVVLGTSGSWVEKAGTLAAPATAVQASYLLYMQPGAVGNRFYADDLEFSLADQDVSHANGGVVIDSSGVTILDGKLTFQDSYGETTMDGYGFGPAWSRYVVNRVYNGDFRAGSTSSIPSGEVGGASTIANYRASVTSLLPGWVVLTNSGGGELKLVADATASGGMAIQSSSAGGAQTSSFYQDIPVIPGEKPRIIRSWRMTRTANSVSINIYASYRDSNHALIGSVLGSGLAFSSTIAAYVFNSDILGLGAAPANAVYLRYRVEIVHNTGSGTTVWISDCKYENDIVATTTQSSSNLTLTTAEQDIPGATKTVEKGRTYLVIATFYWVVSVVGAQAQGFISVDGLTLSSPGSYLSAPTATMAISSTVSCIVDTSPVGSGIIKLRAKKSAAAGTITANAPECVLTVIPL